MSGEAVEEKVSNDPHNEEKNHGNVCSEELAGVNVKETLVTLHEHKNETQTEGVVGNVWHTPGLERQDISRNVSLSEDPHETDVGERNVDPGDKTSHSGDVQQPVEHLVTTVVKNKVTQGTKSGGEENSHVWNTQWSGELEPLWSSVDVGQTVQDSGATVDVGNTGGCDGSKDHGIKDAGQNVSS